MKLLGSTKNKINKDKNGENVLHLEINKVVLIHCNIVNNNQLLHHLSDISPKTFISLKTFDS